MDRILFENLSLRLQIIFLAQKVGVCEGYIRWKKTEYWLTMNYDQEKRGFHL